MAHGPFISASERLEIRRRIAAGERSRDVAESEPTRLHRVRIANGFTGRAVAAELIAS